MNGHQPSKRYQIHHELEHFFLFLFFFLSLRNEHFSKKKHNLKPKKHNPNHPPNPKRAKNKIKRREKRNHLTPTLTQWRPIPVFYHQRGSAGKGWIWGEGQAPVPAAHGGALGEPAPPFLKGFPGLLFWGGGELGEKGEREILGGGKAGGPKNTNFPPPPLPQHQ